MKQEMFSLEISHAHLKRVMPPSCSCSCSDVFQEKMSVTHDGVFATETL